MELDPAVAAQLQSLQQSQETLLAKIVDLGNQNSVLSEALKRAHLIRQSSSSPEDWKFAEYMLQVFTAVEVNPYSLVSAITLTVVFVRVKHTKYAKRRQKLI